MIKNLLFSLVLISNACCLYAQYYNQRTKHLKANAVWAFGENAGLDFNAGRPVGIPTSISNTEGATAAADPVTGRLLFYSDGGGCWSANDQLMPNGSGLLGNGSVGSTSQGVCITPIIDSLGKYYLFSLNYQGSTPALYYSVVDMSLNGGLGDIVTGRKNILLHADPLSEAMIAVPGNNCDIWLVVHESQNPVFKAYHITRDGLDTVPVISNITTIMQGGSAYFVGCMAISPDRETIAIANYNCPGSAPPEELGVLICKFDASTGKVSKGIKIMEDGLYGVCFSPDNTKLYATDNSTSTLTQFDVSTYDSTTIALSSTSVGTAGAYIRLYNDTIYVANMGDNTLSRVDRPNLSGTSCIFQPNILALSTNTASQFGLGNDVVYPLLPDTVRHLLADTLICTSNEEGVFMYPLTLTALSSYYAYEWDDGSIGQTRSVTEPGTYWVLCKDLCHSRVDSYKVHQVNLYFSLGPDTTLCDQASYTLHTGMSDVRYLWQDGNTDSTFLVLGSGTFSVTVFKEGCSASDSIQVYAKSFVQDLGKDTIFCKGIPGNVPLVANVPEGATVTWSTGSHEPAIRVQDSGTYWVRVNEWTCSGSDTLRISQEICTCLFQVPNAFTPNGDGVNDLFWPSIENGCPIHNYVLHVYNRFGQRVFTNINFSNGWDGFFNGNPVDAGTYFYELKFEGGTHHQQYYQKRDIVLIR